MVSSCWRHPTNRIFSFPKGESDDLKFELIGSVCVLYPHEKIPKFIYKCDKKFHLDDLTAFLAQETSSSAPKNVILAVALVSGCKCEFYVVSCLDEKHCKTELLSSFSEDLPNKHRRGGQSSARFGRIHDQTVERYAKKISEIITSLYKDYTVYQLVLAGPADIKNKVSTYLENKKTIILDTPEIVDNKTLNFVLEKCGAALMDMRNLEESRVLTDFEQLLVHNSDILVFGQKETEGAYEAGQLKTLIVSKMIKLDQSTMFKTKILILDDKHDFIKRFGSWTGILYYGNSM